MKAHHFSLSVKWDGNKADGTNAYNSYTRNHQISIDGKETINGSADPGFLGDTTKYNPEELLLASISSCHMLWYLHLCADEGIIVLAYTDAARATMVVAANGRGTFEDVMLNPTVILKNALMIEKATTLHTKANECCFIANAVNFKISHQPTFIVA